MLIDPAESTVPVATRTSRRLSITLTVLPVGIVIDSPGINDTGTMNDRAPIDPGMIPSSPSPARTAPFRVSQTSLPKCRSLVT